MDEKATRRSVCTINRFYEHSPQSIPSIPSIFLLPPFYKNFDDKNGPVLEVLIHLEERVLTAATSS